MNTLSRALPTLFTLLTLLALCAPAQAEPVTGPTRAAAGLQRAAEVAAVTGSPVSDAGAPRTDKAFSNARVELVADRRAVVPGEPLRLAFRFDLDENWHVYDGHNPGSIGLPTTVDWTLPEGFDAAPMLWPAPELYRESSGDVSYVHHDELVLATTVTVPADLEPGGRVELGAEYDFQFCYDKCIRKSGTLDLTLPVLAAGAEGSAAGEFAELFAAADAQRARPAPELARGALSHTPLTPGQAVLAVLELAPPAPGTRLEQPDGGGRPVVVFDKLRGLDVEVLQSEPTAAGGLRLLARLSAGEGFDATKPVPAGFGATVQVIPRRAGADDAAAEPIAWRVPLDLALGPDDASVTASTSALLADVDVESYLARRGDAAPASAPVVPALPLWQALLFALLGGLILNIMPCVLPVLSLKALALVEEANESQRSIRSFVAMYVLGVLASFWALAGVIIAVKMSGQLVGWGFQFQEPGYVLVMVSVIFAFALSLFGVFEIPGLTVAGGSKKSGLRGSFIHGVLTTALSTPCSAPLLGSALTFALAQSPAMIMVTFTLIGAGLALPVSILTLAPGARRFIPRPGPWMETFKHVIAFMLVATAIWLLGVLTGQISDKALVTVYVLLGLIALAAWTVGRFTGPLATLQRKAVAGAVAVCALGAGVYNISLEPPAAGAQESLESELIAWQAFAGEETMALAAQGHTIFIDFTADWCATCKTMEATAIETEAVSQLIRDNNVLAFKADLTRKNPELSRWVEYFGRSAIPLYVIVPAGKPDAVVVLPEVITEGMLLDALRDAGPSTPGAGSRADDATAGIPKG